MVRHLALAWAAWKLSAKRFGPVGGAVFAGLAVVGFVLLRGYLEENHPGIDRAIEQAV